MVYPALLSLMCTPRLPVVDRIDVSSDFNGIVRFAERRNLVSARVPSHFKRSLPAHLFANTICELVTPRYHGYDGGWDSLYFWLDTR